MTARRRLLILLGLVLVLFLAVLRLGASLSARFLARGLSRFFEREVTVGTIRFHLLPLRAEIAGLRVAGATAKAPPFLEVARIVVTPSLAQVWERRLALKELRLERPQVRINAYKRGGDDLPPFGRGGGGGRLRLERLVIQGGELLLDHQRVPVDADLPDFQGRLDVRRDRALSGRLTFGPGQLRFGSAPPLSIGSELVLLLAGRRLVIESGRVHAKDIDVEVSGEIRFGSPVRGEVALRGPVDLAVLDRHVVRTRLGLGGAARIDAMVGIAGSKVEISGRAEGDAGTFDTVPIPVYACDFAWDGSGLRLFGLSFVALSGKATLEVEVPSSSNPRPARIEGRLEEIDAERALAAIFDWGAPGLAAAASGEVAVSWPRGRGREISGRIDVDLHARSDGRTPLSGRFSWSAEQGEQMVELADLKTDSLQARLEGRVLVDRRADLRLDAETTDLRAADDLLRRLRRALGNAEAEEAGLAGSGAFHGRWQGTLGAPVFVGRFTGRDLVWRRVEWGEASAAGALTTEAIEARSLQLRRGAGTLFVDGRFGLGDYGLADEVEGRARLVAWPAADLIQAFDWSLPLEGALTGEAAFRGRRSAPEGEAELQAAEGRYRGVAFTSGRTRVRWGRGTTQVLEGRASLGGGEVRFSGSLTDDGIYDAEATLRAVEVDSLLGGRHEAPLSGRITSELTLQGPLSRPRLRGHLRAPRLFLGDEGLGAIEALIDGTGDGEVRLRATCRSGRVDLSLEGKVEASPPHEADLVLKVLKTSLDPYLRAAFSDVPAALGLVASGEARLLGPLGDIAALRAEVLVDPLDVLAPDYPLRTREPVRLRLEKGVLAMEEMLVDGEGTGLSLQGSVDLMGAGPLELRVAGALDLRALIAVSGRLRGHGAGRLEAALTGTRAEPRVEGSLRLLGAGLRLRGFPHGLEELTGTLRFTESGAALEEVRGRLAGGRLELEGTLAFEGGRLSSFDLRPRGEGLALRWPEGLRSRVNADLRLFGDEKRRFATGEIEVRQAVYTRRYDVASEILAIREPEEAAAEGEGMNLDIQLRAPGTLRIDNNLASLHARADLQLRGTLDAPVLLGHAEVDRGRIYFQGRTYVIRHGSLDFANPSRLDPLFDIEAETRVQSYRVTLRVNGTLERVTPTLTSDPPLTALQILNLLAGADEATVASMTTTRSNEAQLAATGAATLAAGRISEEVGLERGAGRLLGLDRFSIDPSLLRGSGQAPTARVTLGKRITPELNVIYAQDLSGTGERLIAVEYTLSDRFSVLLSRSDPEGFGFDVRLRRSR
jgi:translocation and assembly module TamB